MACFTFILPYLSAFIARAVNTSVQKQTSPVQIINKFTLKNPEILEYTNSILHHTQIKLKEINNSNESSIKRKVSLRYKQYDDKYGQFA